MNPLTVLADIISGIASFLKFRTKKQELVNSPEMQANARAKQDAEIRDAATSAVAKNDLDEIRRRAAP